MPAAKIAVSLDADLLERLDRLERGRLARECAKLDPQAERELAEEGLAEDFARWPAY